MDLAALEQQLIQDSTQWVTLQRNQHRPRARVLTDAEEEALDPHSPYLRGGAPGVRQRPRHHDVSHYFLK